MDPLNWAPGSWTIFWAWPQTVPIMMDQPAGLCLTPATSPGLILTCELTSQLQIWPASSPQICLIMWMPGWTSIPGAALPAMALPLAPGLTAMLALQSSFLGYLVLIWSCEVSTEIQLLWRLRRGITSMGQSLQILSSVSVWALSWGAHKARGKLTFSVSHI